MAKEKPERDKGPHPNLIPWSVAELAYSVYSRGGCSQSLEMLASRGGFGACEMDLFVPNWREMCSEITALRIERDTLSQQLDLAERQLKAACDAFSVGIEEESARAKAIETERDALKRRRGVRRE